MLRHSTLLLALASFAAGDVTTVAAPYVDHVLNARGLGALTYAGTRVNVDSVLEAHPECEKCSAATPCGHKSFLGVGSCVGSLTREVSAGVNVQFCAGADVCCGGTCRNSHKPVLSCTYLNSNVKAEVDVLTYKSALDMLGFIGAGVSPPQASIDGLFNGLLTGDVMAPRCSTNCNGWSAQGSIQPVACASSCGCTAQPLTTFESGTSYVCELKPTTPDADSFFSTGDVTLTKSASFGAHQGKAVCPSGYLCNNPSKCLTASAYAALAPSTQSESTQSESAKTTSSTSSGLSTGGKVGIGIGVSVGVAAIAAAAFFIRRKQLRDEADHGGAYQAMDASDA
ncbi:hypothetical protein SPRG_11138 [Saprolegnia parasitica CBS 223.65]|uniref:Uncharacterized protein n=1 Tax=Saprolegnia parasitica (strain CBS 223.65) TaxID=695850 RepID=A0A067C3L6_SAPPC|nr:hypothetical protein SPRG_11138 [Saprolegnia parasitica CBS 223.65]KDO23690.1 hypothetical protein SPRG_11138 [Saprolegnia parasitica CBS 223.65]|eukprot:XP_012205673.1 hypothetical protein SPRG_11138 [Saprolegnia parasitica CBS 223.65]